MSHDLHDELSQRRNTASNHNSLDIELDNISPSGAEPENVFSLPPADKGKDAWSFLAAAFVMEIMIWGFPWSYGMFQEYYSSNVPFAGASGLPAVGTCAMGVLHMASPIVLGPLIRFPQYKRVAIAAGLFIMCLGLALGSFCQTVPQLIITQGILYGIGGAITYNPIVQLLDEWFIAKKGIAFGIVWAGTGLGGVIVPLVLQYLLNKYGFRTTLRIWTIMLFSISIPLVWFLKPRIPASVMNRPRLTLTFLKNRAFWILQVGNFVQSLGFFIPSIYLPVYTRALGYNSIISALPIIFLNTAAVFGSITMGAIVDRYHVTTGILISTIGSVLSIFFLWGFSTSLAPLTTFSIMYGLFAGSFTNTWPGVLRAVQQSTGQMESPMVYSFLSFGRGFGNVISGPLSDALMKSGKIGAIGLYGTQYGSLVLYSGACAAVGGIGFIGRRVGWL